MATKVLTNTQILLKECIEAEHLENGSYATVNDYFEFFAATHVLKNHNLSDDEIESGISGGGLDGGCDGIYVFLNDSLLTPDQIENLTAARGSSLTLSIIQSKYTTSFNETAIMKWKTVSENLLSMSNSIDDFTGRYNEDILDGFRLFRDAVTKLIRSQIKLHIQYTYITLSSELHPNVQQQAQELADLVKRLYPTTTVDVRFVDADELMDLYNSSCQTNINLPLTDRPISVGRSNDYVALINLATYYRFITDDEGKLRKAFFEANVRDYQGKNAVNNSIAESLSSQTGEDFWWLNNGVTILSSQVNLVTYNELLLVDPEIVNGLQTSTEIYNYFSNNPALLDSETRNLLVRIIVPASEESRDNIIFATNNQTNIPKSSLRVTDPIHLQIEMYFRSRGLYYDRRKNYYKNQRKKPADIVGVSFLAQCLISIILRKPDYARARPSTLLTDDEIYGQLYESNQNLNAYFIAALIGKKVQQALKASAEMTPAERSDILFYLLYAVFSKSLNKKEISFSDLSNFDPQLITDELINELMSTIYAKYKELGGNGRVAKSNTFISEIDTILGV